MKKLNYFSQNWLAHKVNNKCLEKNLKYIKGRVIDMGCGTSPYKEDIVKVADQYIGIDWANSLHDQSSVDIIANLCEPLPIVDCCADTIVSFQVMEHLKEPGKFLLEVFRILKKDGKILITVPFMWHVHEEPYDYFRYTCHGLKYLFDKVGFQDIAITENTGFWQMWVLKFNYHTTRFARGPLRLIWIPIWLLGQVISPLLDKIDKHNQETASYTVFARKP